MRQHSPSASACCNVHAERLTSHVYPQWKQCIYSENQNNQNVQQLLFPRKEVQLVNYCVNSLPGTPPFAIPKWFFFSGGCPTICPLQVQGDRLWGESRQRVAALCEIASARPGCHKGRQVGQDTGHHMGLVISYLPTWLIIRNDVSLKKVTTTIIQMKRKRR